MKNIGFHTSFNYLSLYGAHEADCIQVFLNQPQRYNVIFPSDKVINKNLEILKKNNIEKVYVHSPYVISPENYFDKSTKCIKALLDLMKLYGITKDGSLVVHCLKNCSIDKWKTFLNQFENRNVITLENVPDTEGHSWLELKNICKDTGVKLCLDTNHLWCAGDTLDNIDSLFLSLIHCNTTRLERGCGRVGDHHVKHTLRTGDMKFISDIINKTGNVPMLTEYGYIGITLINELKDVEYLQKLVER